MPEEEIIQPGGDEKSRSRSRQVVKKENNAEITSTEKEEPSREISDPAVFGQYLKQDDELAKLYLQQRMGMEKNQAEFELRKQQKLLDLEEAERIHKLEQERHEFEKTKEIDLIKAKLEEAEHNQRLEIVKKEAERDDIESNRLTEMLVNSNKIYIFSGILFLSFIVGIWSNMPWAGIGFTIVMIVFYSIFLSKNKRVISEEVVKDFLKIRDQFKN